MDVVGVAAQLGDFLPAANVDQVKGVVPAGGGETCAVGAEGQAVDPRANVDSGQVLTRTGIPKSNGMVKCITFHALSRDPFGDWP